MDHYILIGPDHRVVPAPMMVWAQFFADENKRRVALNETRFYRLSSVFLGLDHNFSDRGPPIVFETMLFEREASIREVFGKMRPVHEEQDCWRYATWDDCAAGHMAILRRLQRQEDEALKALAKIKLKT